MPVQLPTVYRCRLAEHPRHGSEEAKAPTARKVRCVLVRSAYRRGNAVARGHVEAAALGAIL